MFTLLLRCLFIGIRRGLITEFFKFLGLLFATFLTLHFYVRVGQFFHTSAFFPKTSAEVLAYAALWGLVILIFKFVGEGWNLIYKSGELSFTMKILGGILAACRTALIGGLIFVLFFVAGNKTLIRNARQSFLSVYLLDLSPRLYALTFDKAVQRFFPSEKKNEEVFALYQQKSNLPSSKH